MPLDLPGLDDPGDLFDPDALPPPPVPPALIPPPADRPAPPRIVGRPYVGQTFLGLDGTGGAPYRIVGSHSYEVLGIDLSPLEVVLAEGVGPADRIDLDFALEGEHVRVEVQDDEGNWWPGPWVLVSRVDDARLPPPRVPYVPDEGGRLLRVTDLVPGDLVLVNRLSGAIAYADADGVARVELTDPLEAGEVFEVYAGRPLLAGAPAEAIVEVSPLRLPWAAPTPDRLRVEQTHLRVSSLRIGFEVRFSHAGSEYGGYFASAREAWLPLPFSPDAGDAVEVWQVADGAESERASVTTVLEVVRPVIRPAVTAGATTLRIDGQVPGFVLTIETPDAVVERVAGIEPEVDLGVPVGPGTVTVWQSVLDSHASSEPVEVTVTPTELHQFPGFAIEIIAQRAPKVIPQFDQVRSAVVALVWPGAEVALLRDDGVILGMGWSGDRISAEIEVFPPLAVGDVLTAFACVGESCSADSPPMEVAPLPEPLPTADILPPAWRGDTQVLVAGNLPGAKVEIEWSDGEEWRSLGGHVLPDPHGQVPIEAIPEAAVSLRAAWTVGAGEPVRGAELRPVDDPGAEGPAEPGELELAVDGLVLGQFYFPSRLDVIVDGGLDFDDGIDDLLPDFAVARVPEFAGGEPFTVVVIAHGDRPEAGAPNPPPYVPSYLGYAWLGHHLATRGLFAISILTPNDQEADGSAVAAALAELETRFPELVGARVLLMGHSDGNAEIVPWAGANASQRSILGLMSFGVQAGLLNDTAFAATSIPFLSVAGTLDYASTQIAPGVRPNVVCSPVNFNHQGWSSVWAAEALAWGPFGPYKSKWPLGSVEEADHQSYGKALVGLFLRFVEDIDGFWRGFGDNQPPAMRRFDSRIFVQRAGMAECPDLVIQTSDTEWDGVHNATGGEVRVNPQDSLFDTSRFTWIVDADARIWQTVDFTDALPAARSDLVIRASSSDGTSIDVLVKLESTDGEEVWLRWTVPPGRPFSGIANSVYQLSHLPLRACRAANPSFDPTDMERLILRALGAETGPQSFLYESLALWCLQ